jgi:RNA polymerase sigma-70 factor (ECF subfamily)
MAVQARAQLVDDPIEGHIRAGDYRAAAAACARLHGAALGRLAMALTGSQADADEIVQETLLAAHGAMAQFRGEGSVRSWLFGIARRMCARRLETRVRQERRLRLVPDDAGTPLDTLVHARRQAAHLRELLERLRPTDREALLLRYHADLSFQEIGAVCGIDEAAARKRASRGLERLRALLAGTQGESE